MVPIAQLWTTTDRTHWDDALVRYWDLVLPGNVQLEREMENLSPQCLQEMDQQKWYEFLLHEYFKWKYTAPNRYATTTMHLKRYASEGSLALLFDIKNRLLSFDTNDVAAGLKTATEIRGLGTAGASGLLALLYPKTFATVDQFVVKALRAVPGLPEASELLRMNPEGLTLRDGKLLIRIMAAKAQANNHAFGTSEWTPRRIDKVLWTFGRD
jgi:hypothetical protein